MPFSSGVYRSRRLCVADSLASRIIHICRIIALRLSQLRTDHFFYKLVYCFLKLFYFRFFSTLAFFIYFRVSLLCKSIPFSTWVNQKNLIQIFLGNLAKLEFVNRFQLPKNLYPHFIGWTLYQNFWMFPVKKFLECLDTVVVCRSQKTKKQLENIFARTRGCVRCIVLKVKPGLKNKWFWIFAVLKVTFLRTTVWTSPQKSQSKIFNL